MLSKFAKVTNIIFLYVTWLRNLLKFQSETSKKAITTNLGKNTYQNEMVAYLHITWPNPAKTIKAIAMFAATTL